MREKTLMMQTKGATQPCLVNIQLLNNTSHGIKQWSAQISRIYSDLVLNVTYNEHCNAACSEWQV